MIPGRDKPHLYKKRGFWVMQYSHKVAVWRVRKAMTYVEKLNAEIRQNLRNLKP